MPNANINPATKQPYKVLIFGDLVTPSGFGRIGNEIARRLVSRGYAVQGASISYTGWPHDLPFWVWPLGNQDIWNGLVNIVNGFQPDVLLSIQDFPYHHSIWHACRIDFSKIRWVWITPIDGTPVHPDWLKLTDYSDGQMVISRFGVEALRQAGKRVSLCHPGVDVREFYPAERAERDALRAKLKWAPDDWAVGVMAMNQGRKAIPAMIEGFHEFARDKPNARLLLDMDKASPAGWDIPNLLKQMGWSEVEQARVAYKEDLFKADFEAFSPLRNRYALLDAHMVISHREGFGLPLLESMACRVPSLALDWCSGTEIAGDGRGGLVRRLPYMEYGTWGGAKDAFPDVADLSRQLEALYADPIMSADMARRGYEWAITNTWDVTADQVEAVIQNAIRNPRKGIEPHEPDTQPSPAPGFADVYGPGHASAIPANPVGDHSGVQPPRQADPLVEVAGAVGVGGGAGGGELAAGDPGPG